MADPITHIVLTEKVFNKHFTDLEKKEFIIGTSFPDIRYLGTISREKTHPQMLTLSELVKLDSFGAGIYYHALVDKVREDFLISRKIYSYCPQSKYITHAIKFLEDKILYKKYGSWHTVMDYFDTLLTEEVITGAGEDTIYKWHNLLKAYFSTEPNDKTIGLFVKEINLPVAVAEEINGIVNEIEGVSQIKSYIEDLYTSFEELINKYK